MRKAWILAAILMGLAAALPAQPRETRPPRPLTFSLGAGVLTDTRSFIDEVGTRAILVPRFWVRPSRGLTLGLEAMIMRDPDADGDRVTAWPGLLVNLGGGGPGAGLGLVLPILNSQARTPRVKLFFQFRPGPVVIHVYAMQRLQASLNTLLGLDAGFGF